MLLLCYCCVQGISPGLVRTEFRGRSQKRDDIAESLKEYETLTEVGPGFFLF